MIRVALADDQVLVRAGFGSLLGAEDDIEVIGEAGDGEEAISLARSSRPDVILMDIRMPRLDGIEATRRIASDASLRAVHVVILTTFELDEYVFEGLRAGAAGFLVKDTDAAELIRAVRVVAAGEALLSRGRSPSRPLVATERCIEPKGTALAGQSKRQNGTEATGVTALRLELQLNARSELMPLPKRQ